MTTLRCDPVNPPFKGANRRTPPGYLSGQTPEFSKSPDM
jgi:hypothetical protein